MKEVKDAVILMAGTGSRLRAAEKTLPKPLMPILGRPLISYILETLRVVGVTRLHVVVGFESDLLLAGLRPLVPAGMDLNPIENPQWRKQNGVSLLCAEGKVEAPFLLLMGDHLFESALLAEFVRRAQPALLNLAIDRKINRIFDLEDAMKVQMSGEKIVAIGKTLAEYDAIDTGVFLCPDEIFAALREVMKGEDCSLADGVRRMAENDRARGVDIESAWWQDVDTVAMRSEAENVLRARTLAGSREPQWSLGAES